MAPVEDTNGSTNDLLSQTIHSFIVKIWREEGRVGQAPEWRGHITHVPTREQRYLKSLADIPEFIKIYLCRMGVHVDLVWRVKQWMKKKRRRPANPCR